MHYNFATRPRTYGRPKPPHLFHEAYTLNRVWLREFDRSKAFMKLQYFFGYWACRPGKRRRRRRPPATYRGSLAERKKKMDRGLTRGQGIEEIALKFPCRHSRPSAALVIHVYPWMELYYIIYIDRYQELSVFGMARVRTPAREPRTWAPWMHVFIHVPLEYVFLARQRLSA